MNELLEPPRQITQTRRPQATVPEPVRRVASTKVKRTESDEDDESVFSRHRKKLVAIVLAVVGGVAAILVFTDKKPATHKAPDRSVVKIQLPPLPAPPPPPPPPPPKIEQPKQEMVKEELPEEKPEETPPEPKPADDPPPLGTGIKGDGPPDGFGLSGNGTGRVGGIGSGGSSRSKWGWYAGQVQRSVSDALRSHRRTRNARMNSIEVRIWPDRSTGRVTRVSLSPSTGDAALDAAIRDEVLGGLQLQQAPPEGMPAPIVMRINARRP